MLLTSKRCVLGADFLTGVYHWSVDNYGSGATPIVGSQIAAFQGHHQRPWTITEREFCNNVHKVEFLGRHWFITLHYRMLRFQR